jgi:hypothetical protein
MAAEASRLLGDDESAADAVGLGDEEGRALDVAEDDRRHQLLQPLALVRIHDGIALIVGGLEVVEEPRDRRQIARRGAPHARGHGARP